MARPRNKRRNRKGKRSQSQTLTSGEWLERAWKSLDEGDGRKALDQLRQAHHAGAEPVALVVPSLCACTRRARQLARNGLVKEAAVMRERATRHRTALSVPALGDEELLRLLRHLDGTEALTVYAESLQARPPVLRAERMLADRLVIQRCWEGLEVLDAGHPLRRDAEPVARSLDAMDAGDWEQAAGLLRGIARRSPFAPWRLLCKAMTCFGAGDDEGLRRTLDLLPDDFPLARTVAECRRACTGEAVGESEGSRDTTAVRWALGTQGSTVTALGEELRQALRRKRSLRDIERLIADLADVLHPEDPLPARMDLLQLAGLAIIGAGRPPKALHGLARRLLPAERVAGTVARIALTAQRLSPALWDPDPAVAYLDRLPVEFPRASDRTLARGRVLESLARTGHEAAVPAFMPPRMLDALATLLGRQVDEPGMLFAELMMASLEADPGNREGHHFLLDLLRGSNARKPRLQSVLQEMAARFPDDPDPWLELATLHYSRNAYRRAERALAEARERAPYDERILDLQAIGFLKSADQSCKKGRLALAEQDLQRAEALDRPGLGIVLRVKRLLLALVSSDGDAARAVAPHLEPLSCGERLGVLALLVLDLDENRGIRNVSTQMRAALRERLAREMTTIDALAPNEVAALFAPLPIDLRILYASRWPARILAEWWPALMVRLDGDPLIEAFDQLLEHGRRDSVRAEIERRLHGVEKARRDRLLLFYLAVIHHLDLPSSGSRRFAEALDGAKPAERERMRAAAARLARHAHGTLREALQKLDFAGLDLPSPIVDLAPFGDLSPFEDLPPLEDLLPFPGNDGSMAQAALASLIDALSADAQGYSSTDGVDELSNEPSFDPLYEELELMSAGAQAPPPGQSQGTLFNDGLLSELMRLEARIDEGHLRDMPLSDIKVGIGVLRATPKLREQLDRIALACRADRLSEMLSRELRTIVFSGDESEGEGGRRRRRGKHRQGT